MHKRIVKICSLVMALSLMILSFAACKGEDEYEKSSTTTPEQTQTSTEAAITPAKMNPFTGLEIADSAVGKRPVALMVENSPAARPQWGLSTPDVVIEGVVEGGVTRMMWLYADVNKIPNKAGPVRSARHDYVEIAYGMNAIYSHSGGSDLAYNLIKNIGMKDIDGLTTEGKYFFRDKTRNTAIEHRLYTSGDYLAKAIADKNLETKAKGTDWSLFKVVENGERISYGDRTGGAVEVKVEFSPSYKHTFKYNAEEKLYYNYMNDKEMKDGNNNKTMSVANVIIMYCDTKVVDDKGHQDWAMTSGTGLYISHGYGEQITWKKASQSSPLKFYGPDGKELIVNKGQSWIGVVPLANKGKTDIKVA